MVITEPEPKDPELSNAYSQTKKWFSENFIEVPKIGLSDGMIYNLFLSKELESF